MEEEWEVCRSATGKYWCRELWQVWDVECSLNRVLNISAIY